MPAPTAARQEKRSRAASWSARERQELWASAAGDVAPGEEDYVPHAAEAVATCAKRSRALERVQGVAVVGDLLDPACAGDLAERPGEVVDGSGPGHAGDRKPHRG